MSKKERIHQLVDQLSERHEETVERFIVSLKEEDDSFLAWLRSLPEERAVLSEKGVAALKEAEEDLIAGRVRPLEEIKRERGL